MAPFIRTSSPDSHRRPFSRDAETDTVSFVMSPPLSVQEKRELRAESLKPKDPQVQELLSELHKIGINLNQIARALNQKDISTLDKIALSIIGETNEQIKSIYSFLAQQKEPQKPEEEPKNDTAIMTKAEIIRANILSSLVDSDDGII